ncbi:hypothetical protein GDV60_03450 [Pseudomonas sp. DTU12.1]|nr:hypothetical protein GDV60_03450 [Pseudomonas sp. DTU12.1]
MGAGLCGSGLARESGGSANLNVYWADVFASKPAPTQARSHTKRISSRPGLLREPSPHPHQTD